jgi:hypothetical protein
MIKRLERLKNTVNKYMAVIRPDRLTSVRTEVGRKSTTKCIPKIVCTVFWETGGYLRALKAGTEEVS